MKFFSKTIISIAVLAGLVSQLFFIAPPEAHAFPVFETNPILVGEASKSIQESFLKIAFEALKKRVFDMMVDQIINYISGNGKPQFITDWQGFLQTAADAAVGDIVLQTGLAQVCNPAFRLQIQLAMVAPPRFSKQISCTLTSIVRNINQFLQDFRNGSWLAYQELWAPQNNFYGSLLLAWDAKENEIAARVMAAQNEALASRGFLSVKKCQKDEFGRDIPRTCVITTPGTAIGALTEKAVGADLDFIINSTDLAAYVAAISDALLNRLIREGVSGLSGVTTPNAPPIQAANNCNLFSGRARQDCLSYQGQYSQYVAQRGQPKQATAAQIDSVLSVRVQAQQIFDGLLAIEDQIIASANSLIVCQAAHTQATDEVRFLLTQQQQNKDRLLQLRSPNDGAVANLLDAKNTLAEEKRNTLPLSNDLIDPQAAQQALAGAQNEQLNQQILIDLQTNLQLRLVQCQGQ